MNTLKKRRIPKESEQDFMRRRFTFEELAQKYLPQPHNPQDKSRELTPYEEGVELAKRLVRFAA